MVELNEILSLTFVAEVGLPNDIEDLLIAGEEAKSAYKTLRDAAVFTNKRFILTDSQGITGRKKEVYSIPYSAINMWSTENAGTMDLSGEIQLWTRAGNIKISLRKGINVREIDQLIASGTL